ncbi:MAG: YdeI/OmpD-associated family protein [Nocardioides sp.]
MGVQDDAERFQPASIDEWSAWLADHHADTPGVWLVTHKQSTGLAAFDYEDAVIEALRWGWVDSTQRTVDEQRTMMWYAARRPDSVWTRRNKVRAAALEASGRMRPAGQVAVDAARASGRWTLMDDVEDLVVPDDLAAELDARPGAREQWESFPPSARKQALAWIVLAKRDETRATRVTEVAESSARGERPRG